MVNYNNSLNNGFLEMDFRSICTVNKKINVNITCKYLYKMYDNIT